MVDPFNYCLLFTEEQLALSSRAAQLSDPSLSTELLLDTESLHDDIRQSLSHDPLLSLPLITLVTNQANDWTVKENGLVYYLRKIFVSDADQESSSRNMIIYWLAILIRRRRDC